MPSLPAYFFIPPNSLIGSFSSKAVRTCCSDGIFDSTFGLSPIFEFKMINCWQVLSKLLLDKLLDVLVPPIRRRQRAPSCDGPAA